MDLEAYQSLLWILGLATFGLVISLWMIGLLLYNIKSSMQAQRMDQRLGLVDDAYEGDARILRLWKDGEYVSTVVHEDSVRTSIEMKLEQMREVLGWQVPLSSVVLGLIGLAILGFMVGFVLTMSPLGGIGGMALAVAIPYMVVNYRINKQMQVFETQLVEALGLAKRSLRAGHPLAGAFDMISEEMEAPVSNVFAEIMQLQSLGVGMEEAIRRAAVRSSSMDFRLFAAAIVIQMRSGGNLADMMDRLSEVIRDRIRLHRRAKILTSQTQLSKNVLVSVPIFLFGLLHVLSPEYISTLYSTTIGKVLLVIGVVLLWLGVIVMNRIAVLKY